MTTIAVVDYGMGNLKSVAKAMEHVAPRSRIIISSSAREIHSADKIVFPGQGAARACMDALNTHDLVAAVGDAFQSKPCLGICMGLQVLFDSSDENNGVPCLGYVGGKVSRFVRENGSLGCKIPHMGWNEVVHKNQHPLWKNIADQSRFYFVHSYYVKPKDENVISGSTNYLGDFCSAISNENVFATQFHPEKSAADGLQLLKNFSQWMPT